jgi:hypothetical protein
MVKKQIEKKVNSNILEEIKKKRSSILVWQLLCN